MNSFTIKKPWVTEKATRLAEAGQYVFLVATGATKPEIKKAIKELYKVDAVSVNIVNRPAKQKRFRGVMHATGGRERKAIVTVKKGQKIDIS
ncbi:MAG: 50S ribosomal protein L23 [Minisyncoccia bacterium]|jgi:large subunit ribosomal protein L23